LPQGEIPMRSEPETSRTTIIRADDLSVRANAEGCRHRERAGKVKGSETACAQQVSVEVPGGIGEVANDLTPIVNSVGLRTCHRTGNVDSGERARAEQKAVLVAPRIEIVPHNLGQVTPNATRDLHSKGFIRFSPFLLEGCV
jgi:hypothetical protein